LLPKPLPHGHALLRALILNEWSTTHPAPTHGRCPAALHKATVSCLILRAGHCAQGHGQPWLVERLMSTHTPTTIMAPPAAKDGRASLTQAFTHDHHCVARPGPWVEVLKCVCVCVCVCPTDPHQEHIAYSHKDWMDVSMLTLRDHDTQCH
jgi:hypothetical protein